MGDNTTSSAHSLEGGVPDGDVSGVGAVNRMTAPPWLDAAAGQLQPPTASHLDRTGAQPCPASTEPADRTNRVRTKTPHRIVVSSRDTQDRARREPAEVVAGRSGTSSLRRWSLGDELDRPGTTPPPTARRVTGVNTPRPRTGPAAPATVAPVGGRTHGPRPHTRALSRAGTITALVVGAALILSLTATVGYRLTADVDDDEITVVTDARDSVEPTLGASESAPGEPMCPKVTEPAHWVGDGPGDLYHPAGAVLAFNYSYYVERSAEHAFDAVAPHSALDPVVLQRDGIDYVHPGTRHCVDAQVRDLDTVEVALTERPPDSDAVVFHQVVKLERHLDGKWGIVSINRAE